MGKAKGFPNEPLLALRLLLIARMSWTPPMHYPMPSIEEAQRRASPSLVIAVCVLVMIGLALVATTLFIRGDVILGFLSIVAVLALGFGIWYVGSNSKKKGV